MNLQNAWRLDNKAYYWVENHSRYRLHRRPSYSKTSTFRGMWLYNLWRSRTRHALSSAHLIISNANKELILVGDQHQIQPYRMGELKYVLHYNDTSIARFVAYSAPWAIVELNCTTSIPLSNYMWTSIQSRIRWNLNFWNTRLLENDSNRNTLLMWQAYPVQLTIYLDIANHSLHTPFVTFHNAIWL